MGPSSETTGEMGFKLVPASRQFFDVPITVFTLTYFLITATFHFGNATLWRVHYLDWLDDKKSITRWVEYYFSAGLMIIIIGYTSGIRSFIELSFLFCLIATTMTFGLLSDMLNRPNPSEDSWLITSASERLVPHLLGYPPMLAAWAGVAFALLRNWSECGPPLFVYATISCEFVLFLSFGIPQFYQVISAPSKFIYGEYAYQIMSFLAKSTLASILLSFVLFYDSYDEYIANNLANYTKCSLGVIDSSSSP